MSSGPGAFTFGSGFGSLLGSVVRSGGANAILVGRRRVSVLVNRERRQAKVMVVARVAYRKGNSSKMDSMEVVEPCVRTV